MERRAQIVDRIGAERPRNLDVTGFRKREKFICWNRTEHRAGHPWLGYTAEDDFTSRLFGQDHPADGLHLRQQCGRMRPLVVLPAGCDFAHANDAANDRRMLAVASFVLTSTRRCPERYQP